MPVKTKSPEVKQYVYGDQKRPNNPPVGLVTAETDHLNGKKAYGLDLHFDPQLQWVGKTEGTNLVVDTVSLHVHERIDPLTIIQAVSSRAQKEQSSLFGYFEYKENNPPIREAIEFYKHSQGWSNRLVAGDSLLVMNSLLEKEGMAGKVQMVYVDPPYGIKYGSNFQPFVNQRDVRDGKDEDLTQEPEMVKAFRDTWELGIHSYLTYLRNRLLLAGDLLAESGSIFVQINDTNLSLVKQILDETFQTANFCGIIIYKKTQWQSTNLLPNLCDFILWYAKDITKVKFRSLFVDAGLQERNPSLLYVQLADGTTRKLTKQEEQNFPVGIKGSKFFESRALTSQGSSSRPEEDYFTFNGKKYHPGPNQHWKTTLEGMKRLAEAGRLMEARDSLRYKRFLDDFPFTALTNIWTDTITGSFTESKRYAVQTNTKVIERCLLMTTQPGDLVFDPTCGSGTTAFVAEQWGRRWISCDTSRVSITIAKERLMTALFDYYELRDINKGVSGDFKYQEVSHVTLGSVAKSEPPEKEALYDQPKVDSTKKRVTGPFTVEAVPSHSVRSLETIESSNSRPDSSIARSGETLRQNDWIDELLSTGVRGKGGQSIEFARVEPLGGTRWINAEAETKDGKKAVISFGPEYAPLEQRQVELAIEEAQQLVPRPKLVIFASFQFDPEAAKDLDELKWPGVDVLKVQMNTDLLTADLKKKRASNESFWLIGQPDVELNKMNKDYQVIVNGFDYYNPRSGELESGDASRVAMWELDTDYDGRSLYPRQVFFPMAGGDRGWSKLARNLREQIDEDKIESYRGNKSLPFKLGDNKQIAVKIIDDRGIESLKIIRARG